MRINLLFKVLILGLVFFSFGCKEKVLKPSALPGYWKLQKATRENQATTTLDNTWLEFSGNQANTNLPLGIGETLTFSTKNDLLTLKGVGEQTFQVLAMDDSTMQLSFETRGIEFKIDLSKSIKPTETPISAQPVEQ